MDMHMVGNQIALLRKRKGLTQTELGQRLGISFQAVSKWERGETLPDTALLPDLAEAVLQNLAAGKYIDLTEVKNGFAQDHFREIVLKHCARYGIK